LNLRYKTIQVNLGAPRGSVLGPSLKT